MIKSEEASYKGQPSFASWNVWESLDAPLSDLFLSSIVPSYLTAKDLLSLSAVSIRYRDLFGSKSLLASILKRDATHNPSSRKYYDCVDQLPTFGSHRTPDDALLDEPSIVMSLHQAALRRRSLILISSKKSIEDCQQQPEITQGRATVTSGNSTTEQQEELKSIVREYCPRSLRGLHIRHRYLTNNWNGRTQFLCYNETRVNIFCHWIDFQGNLVVRDGDCIPPSPEMTGTENTVTDGRVQTMTPREAIRSQRSWRITNEREQPSHLFRHYSFVFQSFALCFSEGGTPFAIYEQRRCWNRTSMNVPNVGSAVGEHCHAIAVTEVPKSGEGSVQLGQLIPLSSSADTMLAIEELHCNSVMHRDPQRTRGYVLYNTVYDRQTGDVTNEMQIRQIVASRNSTGGMATELAPTASVANHSDARDRHKQRRFGYAMARVFYGDKVPDIRDPLWRRQLQHTEIASFYPAEVSRVACNGPVHFTSAVGEALYWQGMGIAGNGDS